MASEFPKYTDMQRTRIIERPGEGAPVRDAIGSTQLIPKREGLLDGLSIPQVIASAGAAATSMLLASKIGIAGSVIGAAVSSVVTIVATQLYRRALNAGARKLQQAAVTPTAGHPDPNDPYGIGSNLPRPSAEPGAPRGARIAPTKLQARAAAERAGMQRKVAAASIGVAVLAVALVTALILMTTSGEGLGTKPAPLLSDRVAPSRQVDGEHDGQTGGTQADKPAGQQDQAQPTPEKSEASDATGTTEGGAQKPDADAGAKSDQQKPGDAGTGGETTDGGAVDGGQESKPEAPGADGQKPIEPEGSGESQPL